MPAFTLVDYAQKTAHESPFYTAFLYRGPKSPLYSNSVSLHSGMD
jgi:hypothetical protein